MTSHTTFDCKKQLVCDSHDSNIVVHAGQHWFEILEKKGTLRNTSGMSLQQTQQQSHIVFSQNDHVRTSRRLVQIMQGGRMQGGNRYFEGDPLLSAN